MKNIFLISITVFLFGCNANNQGQADPVLQPSNTNTFHIDSGFLKESSQTQDTSYTEPLPDDLRPIRENFKRINSITKWTTIQKEDLDAPSEGGEATFYYLSGNLEKIISRYFGETFQLLTEYYLLNGQLSFVFEKTYRYNRPFYYDSTSMKENKDNEAFDFKKSEIIEDRSYFEKGKLIHKMNSKNYGSPLAKDSLLDVQKRLMTQFDMLKAISKS